MAAAGARGRSLGRRQQVRGNDVETKRMHDLSMDRALTTHSNEPELGVSGSTRGDGGGKSTRGMHQEARRLPVRRGWRAQAMPIAG